MQQFEVNQTTNQKDLNELQEAFEEVVNDPNNGFADADLLQQLNFHMKDYKGNYMCIITLALFNLFTVGYTKGFESGASKCQ